MLRAKLDYWEWKLLIISSQFLYTDEMILHQWKTFFERYFPLQITMYGIQLVQQMTEML